MSKQSYTYCVITANRPIGKKFDADLNKTALPITGGSANIFDGTITEIGYDLSQFSESECLTVGVPKVDSCFLTTAATGKNGTVRNGVPVLTKSNENWILPNEPGLVMFDHDPGHWDGEPIKNLKHYAKLLGKALGIEMSEYDYIARPSSSSFIYDGNNNKTEVVGLVGAHIYLGVTNLADLDSSALEALAFQNGFGCGVVSKSGSILKRGLFDSALHKAPSQPVFAGPPLFEGEHFSGCTLNLVNEGRPLDLKSLQGNARHERAEAAWDAIRLGLGADAAAAREDFIDRMAEKGVSRDQVETACGGELPGSWPIYFDDGTEVLLRDIINSPGAYNGRTDVRDPLEPDYGPSKAKLFIADNAVTVHSFAHGGRTFRCFLDLGSFAALASSNDEWPALIALLDGAYKPTEIVDALKEAGVEETKTTLKEKVKRLKRQAATAQAKAGDWAARYAYLSEGGKFVSLPNLVQHQLMITIPVFSFNILHAEAAGPNGESPATWLVKGGMIPAYDRVISRPPERLGAPAPAEAGALNIWQAGPPVEPFLAEPLQWLELAQVLYPVEEERENLLDWMAFQLQYPGRKCNWQIMLHGQEGIGKDSLIHPMRWGMGYHNTVDVTTQELLSDFNSYLLKGSQLLVLQELDAGHKVAAANKLKPLAAAPPAKHMVNQKNEKPVYVDNVQGVVVLTNEGHPVSLNKGDRRWYMLSSACAPLGGEFFKRLWGWYNAGGVRQVAGWLAARDLSDFNPDVLPGTTEFKEKVIDMSQTSCQITVEEVVENMEFLDLNWLVAACQEKGEKVNRRQVIQALNNLGWQHVKPTKKVEGKVMQVRGWVSPGCELTGGALFDALKKVKYLAG